MNLTGINAVNLISAKGFNWYGFIIGSAMVICIVIAYFMAKSRGYYKDLVFDIVIFAIPCAIVGARLYYVIFDVIANPDANWTFKKIIGAEGGLSGLAIYGGLIGACLGALITVALQKKKPVYEKASFLQMADFAFVTIILGQAIGRWGNFANQEAYGNRVTDPTLQWFPYAVFIDSENSWFQATFFYESMWNLIGFGLLMWLYMGKRKSFDGFVLCSYCIWYGIGRFFIEGLRSDSLWLVPGTIRVSQLLSALLIIFAAVFIIVHVYLARKNDKIPFLFVKEEELNSDYYGYEKSIFYRRTLKTAEDVKTEKKAEPEFEDVDDSDRYWETGTDDGLVKKKRKTVREEKSDEESTDGGNE